MTVVDTRPDDAHAHDDHPDFLAHHWDTPQQQFDAAKTGMWLFLATELLFFGGLFCVYAVFRGTRPEIFSYGSLFLDTNLGAINTAVLIISSFTMALGVTAAQRDQRRLLVACLALTIVGGGIFMTIKYFEYEHKIHANLVWGLKFYEDPHLGDPEGGALAGAAIGEPEEEHADPVKGRDLWMATCRACHGLGGEGITGQGKDIRGSAFIAERSDKELLAFIKVGRMPFDALNTTGIQMPPKGGNPLLKEPDLRHIIAYIRTFEPAPAGGGGAEGATGGEDTAAPEGEAPEEAFWIPLSSVPPPPTGPKALDGAALLVQEQPWRAGGGPAAHDTAVHAERDHVHDPDRPANAHLFFAIYYCMTGLHGIHVLVGMGVMTWLLVRAIRGHFTSAYFTPVDLFGLYWHVVDLIWIFLFPLFYLIH